MVSGERAILRDPPEGFDDEMLRAPENARLYCRGFEDGEARKPLADHSLVYRAGYWDGQSTRAAARASRLARGEVLPAM